MMVEWVATTAPIFTLYGDGTVIFRNPTDPMPESQDGFIRNNPFRIARLSEPQIQELLAFAINDGALGIAREKYENNLIADATTTSFTVQAAGKTKRVEVYALAEAAEDGPDAAVRNAFAELAAYLKDFEAQAEVAASDWQPTSYRGALIESAFGAPAEWPWPAIGVDDFEKPDDPNVFGLPTREMTVEEIAALGVADPEGGVHGIYLEGPDGKTYSFVIRPLLPDETA